ncbi:hypothetical protein [Rhodococcoides fascians]|uniref:hypothetical protein n=1 Tax=Rhodococcoides fascians TaxID=1828 RepID=UPI0005663014|nr:hypothetical protein [Rhodococcus fascians]
MADTETKFQVGDIVSYHDERAVRNGDDWYLLPEHWGTVIESLHGIDYIEVRWRDLDGGQGPFRARDLRLRTPASAAKVGE